MFLIVCAFLYVCINTFLFLFIFISVLVSYFSKIVTSA